MTLKSNKKRITTIIIIVIALIAIIGAIVATFLISKSNPSLGNLIFNSNKEQITGIMISMYPQTEYYTGDELNLEGLKLQVLATTNEASYFIDHTDPELKISGFDSSTVGEKTITVSYREFSDTFTVTVKEMQTPPATTTKVLTSIRLSDNFKTTYTLRKWNTSGPNFKDVYLICTFSDGSEESIPMSNNYIDPPNFRIDSPCTYELVLRYSIGGTEVTETVEIVLTN